MMVPSKRLEISQLISWGNQSAWMLSENFMLLGRSGLQSSNLDPVMLYSCNILSYWSTTEMEFPITAIFLWKSLLKEMLKLSTSWNDKSSGGLLCEWDCMPNNCTSRNQIQGHHTLIKEKWNCGQTPNRAHIQWSALVEQRPEQKIVVNENWTWHQLEMLCGFRCWQLTKRNRRDRKYPPFCYTRVCSHVRPREQICASSWMWYQ